MCYPLLNSLKVKGLSKCLCPSPPWAYKIIHLLLLPMWFFFQLVNCYNDNLDKVGFNTNVTIRTVKRLLMFRTEFWTFETKKKKQNKNKSLPLEFQITGMENLHRKSKDADFHLQFLWRQSLDPSLLCVWSSRTSKLLFKLSEKLTAQSACWEGWFYWLFFLSATDMTNRTKFCTLLIAHFMNSLWKEIDHRLVNYSKCHILKVCGIARPIRKNSRFYTFWSTSNTLLIKLMMLTMLT